MGHHVRHEEAGIDSILDRRYRLRREIARGGYGAVFEAEHAVTHGRVAIKTLLRAALDLPSAQTRLLREARVLAALRHPSIIAVYDAGVCPKHGPYLVMEMIEGRPLDGILLTRQKLSVPQTVAVVSQLCGALTDVHRHGVVHRDVKPGNVLIARGAEGERVELIDFGVAKVDPEQRAGAEKLTELGEVLGTIEYMAPEQLMGNAPVTHLSDVYAVGALIYECLTGEVPFSGDPTQVITSMLMISRGMAPLTLPSSVPAPLQPVLRKALEMAPENRYASVAELAAACAAPFGGVIAALDLLDAHKHVAPDLAPALAPAHGTAASVGRRHPRAPYVTPVRVVAGRNTLDGRTEDISEGGVLMIVEGSIADGERITLRLPLPLSGRVVQFEARSKWVKTRRNQGAIGAEFTDVTEDVLTEIRKYVGLMSGARTTVAVVET